MLLTDDELELVRETVALQSGMDRELVDRCSRLIHIDAFDEAVQQAFVVLEERLRKILKMHSGTGGKIIQNGFSENGLFTKLLADNKTERDGLEHLLLGAFSLYRNAAAHTIVGFSGADARSIIGLVDLILRRVDQLAALPRPGTLPANVERTLLLVEKNSNANVARQVRLFLAKCAHLGMEIDTTATIYIPFKKRPLTKRDKWEKPRPHQLAVFYFYNAGKDQQLWFPVNAYYKYVVDIDTNDVIKRLRNLGFYIAGATQDPYLSVNTIREKNYYEELFAEVQKIAEELDATLNSSN